MVKVKVAKAVGKRKCQAEDTAAENSGDEYLPVAIIAHHPGSTTHPYTLDEGPSTPAITAQLQATPILPATSINTTAPSGTVQFPTLGGLQRELNDLQLQVMHMKKGQEQLESENLML